MNILRVADETRIPWFMEEETKPTINQVQQELVENVNISEEVDETVLAQECDKIEVCASNRSPYHYNSQWDKEVVGHLREYAIACGLDLNKFKSCDVSTLKASTVKPLVKTASVELDAPLSVGQELKELWKDPFNIDERSNTSHMDQSNWEQVKPQSTLAKPTAVNNGIRSIGGGEDYYLNSDVNPARNQNSITNPDAIKQLAESKVMDNGERLRKQIVAKETQKLKEHKAWQQEKVDGMKGSDIIPRGTVFPTESLNASTGLGHQPVHGGVYGNVNDIPDLTAGEQISSNNEERKSSIQRHRDADVWETPSRESSRQISDLFAESLASHFKK